MDPLLPLAVVVPLSTAAVISAANLFFKEHRRILDGAAILAAMAVVAMLLVILLETGRGEDVYWFAGVHPHHGVAIGVDFAVGELNAGLAALTAVLVLASMSFSWRYFEEASTWYQTLMLVFLAGMVGFCLTGDIFDLFVWFEVMGVAAYALTGYRPEEKGPIQGGLNFAITNSVAAYLSLSGIGLIYARTGALNMAQVGRTLATHRPDSLVVVAFILILTGLLTKGAVAPFHFWLADAHAVAPTPVCVLFSGVMVELGLYGVARVYWSMFGDALGHRGTITAALLALGTLTAVAGAVFCFRQRHLKRLLAFSTVSHAGLFLIGIAVLSPLGMAGAAVYVIGHGLVKAALFICVGIVLHRLGSINETHLHGRGRALRATGLTFTLAAFGLAGLPPFATYLGAGWVSDTASTHGAEFVFAVVILSSMIVGGAVLRVAGGVFYGLGEAPPEDARMAAADNEETSETEGHKDKTPLTMIGPAALLVLAALGIGLLPHLGNVLEHAAVQLEDQRGYNAAVLRGAVPRHPVALMAAEGTGVKVADVLSALGTAFGSLLLALAALYRNRIRVPRVRVDGLRRVMDSLQSGVVNDYITWMTLGVASLCGALLLSIR